MSLFFENNTKLKQRLDTLPESYTNSEIFAMVRNLIDDMESTTEEFEDAARKTMYYSDKHRKLCLSYPMLFRGLVRGTFSADMLTTFLAAKASVDSGELDKEEAQNLLVDAGVKHIQSRRK